MFVIEESWISLFVFFFCFFATRLETSVFWDTVNKEIPSLSFWNLHSSLVRHIFHPWHAPLLLCWNMDVFVYHGIKKNLKQRSWGKDDSRLLTHSLVPCKHVIFSSSWVFGSVFRESSYFVFVACQLVLWSVAGKMKNATELFDAVFLYSSHFQFLLLIARYDIPFWVWHSFNGLYLFFLLQVS